MFIPSTAPYVTYFYALGNTPAVCLTRDLPQGRDAAILLLGCGDVRNILYTAYLEEGFPHRNFDITCCDLQVGIIARNVLFFSLLLDTSVAPENDSLWSLYYDLYLDREIISILRTQLQGLLDASETLADWQGSRYDKRLRFCDSASLASVRELWSKYLSATLLADDARHAQAFEEKLQPSRDVYSRQAGSGGNVLTGFRSVAPLSSTASLDDIAGAYKEFWKHDSTSTSTSARSPNPLFSESLTQNTLLHYGADPVLGFQLAAAYAKAEAKPSSQSGRVSLGVSGVISAAKAQFKQWVSAFCATKSQFCFRFVVADALAFCHTLQYTLDTGTMSANLYKAQMSTQPLVLNLEDYGSKGNAPKMFDIVDSSNLADHLGALNILIAASPLLKASMSSTLYMETLLKSEKSRIAAFDQLLPGQPSTISVLLGMACMEYITNATTVSSVDELVISVSRGSSPEMTQLLTRLSWKLNTALAGMETPHRLHIDASSLAKVMFQAYLQMFDHEDMLNMFDSVLSQQHAKILRSAFPHFHRGSLATLLKAIRHNVEADWSSMCQILLNLIEQDTRLPTSKAHSADFRAQLHIQGVYTTGIDSGEPETQSVGKPKYSGDATTAVSLVIPRSRFDQLFTRATVASSPTFHGFVAGPKAGSMGQHHFADVQLVFGTIRAEGDPGKDDQPISIDQDADGWLGNSSLVASFYVPDFCLQGDRAAISVGLRVEASPQNVRIFGERLGAGMVLFESTLNASEKVIVTKYLPDQRGYPMTSSSAVAMRLRGKPTAIHTLTGHLDINSAQGKALLANKSPIKLTQASPFVIAVTFGQEGLVCPIQYPLPVMKEKANLRVARKSSYVEVIAPIAHPLKSEALAEFIFPTILGPESIPITANISHLNLDRLPMIKVTNNSLTWIRMLLGPIFSVREAALRATGGPGGGLTESPRVNFKESVNTMLGYFTGSGANGQRLNFFALNHPQRGGVHMMIFIKSIRLDGAAASIVADAAVLPLTIDLVKSQRMQWFLSGITGTVCTTKVDDAELALWKRTIPALVERCRTWSHGPRCEYKKPGATIPLSVEPAEQFLCSCGQGKLPKDFRFPEIEGFDDAVGYMTRIALSPPYSAPFVEDILPQMPTDISSALKSLSLRKCGNCGKNEGATGVSLKKCSRCQSVEYCSTACQKQDWSQHRKRCAKK
ncbi:MYND finger family protein [Xylariomycetidae sp. FL0641]|nr:MYND finger family protein [Xylariomycetidae sp. FL0641]